MYFSVIIPIYNAERYLKECIDSVLYQSFEDFELILVDDGSTDSSGAICDGYAAKDGRIKVIHKQNGGQSTARNRGVACAQGRYLLFLDSDDFINSKTFMEELKQASVDDTDIVAFRYMKYYSDHSSDCGIKMNGLDGLKKIDLLAELVRRDAFFCSCWSKTVKAALIKENGIQFDESLSCEDMDWYFNVVLKSATMKVIDKPFICYRQREGSVTSSGYKEKNLLDYITTIRRWKDTLENMPEGEERTIMLSALAKLYCNLLIAFSRNYDEAKNHAGEVFEFKTLLQMDLNPRTRVFHSISRLIGIKGMCKSVQVIERIRGV